MRITVGQAKGRVLAGPKDQSIRPTSDQVKEAIFNIVGQDLRDYWVLDLFSGTGSLGIEAISRGARKAVFVDNARLSISLIKKNLASCGFEDAGIVLRRDLIKGISRINLPEGQAFDLVFLDPPYQKGLLQFMIKDVAKGTILAPRAQIITEHSKKESMPLSIGHIRMKKNRTYGDTSISLYMKED